VAQLRIAIRSLLKTPFVTAVAIASVALGIGANAAIYSLFDQMLIRKLPVREPGDLVNFAVTGPMMGSTSCNQAGDCDEIFSYAMFRDLEEGQAVFTGIAAHRSFGANLAFQGQTEAGQGMLVSGSYFPLLGLQPHLGRLIGPADDQNIGEHALVVLSHDYWRNRLGSDPGVVNRVIVINGQPLTIIGVAPAGFAGTTLGTTPDVYVPMTMRGQMQSGWDQFDNRNSHWAYLFGRLAPDVTIEQASASINVLFSGIVNEVEAPIQEGLSDQTMARFRAKEITLAPGERGQSGLHSEARIPLIMLFSITGVVLLIACANIANLLLARGANRSQEMAIRSAIGGSRWRLFGQLLTESFVLAVCGGAASLLVAWWTLAIVGSLLPAEATAALDLAIALPVVVFTGLLSIGTGVLFGVYPALQSTRPDLIAIIKSNTGQPSGARAAARFRSGLVIAQIALSLALLVGAGLFIKSLVNVARVDVGLQTSNIVTFTISPLRNGYQPEETKTLFERAEQELAALPGVTAVSTAMVPVLGGSNWGTNVSVEGFDAGPDTDTNSRYNEVGPDYFSTLGMPLLAGREFTISDAGESTPVAVVNETFTRKFNLDGRSAIGKFMAIGRTDELNMQIVGLVQDAKYSEVKQEIPPLFFMPYKQDESIGAINFYIRTAVEPAQVVSSIRSTMLGLDPNLPLEDMKTLEDQVKESVVIDRVISLLAAAFAGLATILAAVGLYGVLTYIIGQRTREIGLRMALGANAERVRRMVLRQMAGMLAVGGIIGLVAAFGLGRAAQSLLFELEGHDPVVMVAATVLLSVVALAAAFLPALRASRVDPMSALRYE
jgi:predicted permease